jgi:histidinol-phosphatase (PHP family)
MFDFHVHTYYSDDSSIDMESYIAPAIAKGLKGICFTDHVDLEYPNDEVHFQFDYKKYLNEIEKLKDKYAGKLEILVGIEFGMQPHIIESDQSFFLDKHFDYVLGSIHTAARKELYNADFSQSGSEGKMILDYFHDMIYCVENFKCYNNLGHLDAISRYVPRGSFAAAKHMDYIEEVLRIIIKEGKGIELNTSGKRYGLPDFHPEPSILRLYKNLGGEIITLGSDSHNPSTLANEFTEAAALLQSCGFSYYSIFRKGKAEFIKL